MVADPDYPGPAPSGNFNRAHGELRGRPIYLYLVLKGLPLVRSGFLQKKYSYKRWHKRLLTAAFDSLGALFFFPFKIRGRLDLARVRKILVLRLDPLGDTVMTRPALAALHESLPNVQIDLLVSKELAPLFEDAREIREIMGLEHHWFKRKSSLPQMAADALETARKIRSQHYDLAIDFRGDLRNILLLKIAGIRHVIAYGITGGKFLLTASRPYDWEAHQVEVSMNLLDCLGLARRNPQEQYPFVYSGSRKWRFWNSLGKDLAPEARFRVIVHAGAGYPSKRWPEKYFQELIDALLKISGMEVILIGTEEEKNMLAPEPGKKTPVDFRGRTELRDLPVLFDACHLYIGNDSGPAHVAAAQGMPLVSIFSGTNPAAVWKPWTRKALELLTYSIECSPCEAQVCPLKHHRCMTEIKPQQVFEKALKLLNLRIHET